MKNLFALLSVAAAGAWGAAVAPAPASAPVIACRLELDRGVLPSDVAQKAVLKVTLEAGAALAPAVRAPVNLAVVLDRSGSMRGEKIERARDAAVQALRRLGERDRFALVAYDSTVQTVAPAQSAANAAWIEDRIRAVTPGGRTALFGGVSQGAAEVRKALGESRVHRIILLSDGMANVGPSAPDDLGRLGAALIKEGISVTTIGVGADFNEDLMARLARTSDGNTYFAASSADLARIFAGELGDVLNVAATRVRVSVECSEGVTPLNIVGREGRISGRKAELYLNQLYGAQQKYVLVELEIPAGKRGETRDVASARVVYENPFTRAEETTEAAARARFSDDGAEIATAANSEVQKAIQFNFNALAQDRAIELADKGQTKLAAQELRQSAEKLIELGNRLSDADLLGKAAEVERQIAELEARGMTPESRKQMRASVHQEMNQQSAR